MTGPDVTRTAAQHASTAARFSELVAGVTDWQVPAPVQGWTARDVVRHLTDWLPGLLAAGSDVRLPIEPSVDVDPVRRWQAQTDAVQHLLEDPAQAALPVVNPNFAPDATVASVIGQFYLPDVFMHTWDLARSTGQPDRLDEQQASQMLDGMEAIEPMLRASGQFGIRQTVGDDADATDRLIAFIGRDPHWRPR